MCDEAGIDLEIIDLIQDDDAKVSSSEIRSALAEGVIDRVNGLLGRRFSLHGPVVLGAERGRTIGFPTANIAVGADLALPAYGVYATICHVEDREYQSVTNVGVRPTIEDDPAVSVESHLFDFEGDIYGRDARIDFVRFLRGERKFDGLDALKEQIARDCDDAREALR
jgi:riboflavin kinase/FMN adenylyltransferase